MSTYSRRTILKLLSSFLVGASVVTRDLTLADANDNSEVSENIGITPAPGPVLRSLYTTYPVRWNIIKERTGDDIEIYFRIPLTVKSGSYSAPAGCAAAAWRVTRAMGGTSFPWRRVGNSWEKKIVFGYTARIAFGCGYAPRSMSSAEAQRMARTYYIRYTT